MIIEKVKVWVIECESFEVQGISESIQTLCQGTSC